MEQRGRLDGDDASWDGIAPSGANAADLLSHLYASCQEARDRLIDLEGSLAKAQGLLGQWMENVRGANQRLLSSDPQHSALSSPSHMPSPAPTLLVHCLGRFRAVLDGQPLHSNRKNKSDGILKLLLAHLGNSLPKDALIEAFWPTASMQAGDASFRVAMHNLRKKLGRTYKSQVQEFIVFRGGNYSLNTQAPLTVDFMEFERHWESGRLLESAGRELEAIAEYRRAEAWYRGDFLEEDLYEEWASVKREALRDTYLTVLGKIADFNLRIGDYPSCVEFSHKLLNKDSFREDAYQYLMLSYARLGDRTRAQRWYKVCRETLHRGLRQPPSPETEALYHRIARGFSL